MERYTQLIRMQRCLVGECRHEVTVRCINGRYHVRVLLNGQVNQEAVCNSRMDIGYTARSLLRWEDKCGNISDYARSARKRHNRKDFIEASYGTSSKGKNYEACNHYPA